MITTWPSQDAKKRFDELIDKTLSEGCQVITRRGVPVVMVVPAVEAKKKKPRIGNLASFFLNSPLAGSGLEIVRDRDMGRDVVL